MRIGDAVADRTSESSDSWLAPTRVNLSRSEQSPIEGDRRLRPHRNKGGVRVIGIDDDVQVAPGGYDGRNDKQSRSSALDPISTESLGDREIAQIVPTGVRGGIKCLA